jgi:hypothetical protein
MPAPTANEIKAQLKTLLTPVIGTMGTRKTKIVDNLHFAPAEGSDPTPIRSSLDEYTFFEGEGTQRRINCLIISEAGFGQSPGARDSTLLLTEARGKKIIIRRFRLTFFYEMSLASGGESPSENEISEIIELVRVKLNQTPRLGFAMTITTGTEYHDGPGKFIEGHDGLQLPDLVPFPFQQVDAHVGEGLLSVRLIEPQEMITG